MKIMAAITRTLVYLVSLAVAVGADTAELTCDCGRVNEGRNAGGTEVPNNKYPMMARLETRFTQAPFCSGTIITRRHVLTAAHCYDSATIFTRVRVGAQKSPAGGWTYSVKGFIVHWQYMPCSVGRNYNIAIVVTKKMMDYNSNVGPACMPNSQLSLVGKEVIALGWGRTTDEGPASDVLQEVALTVLPYMRCYTPMKIMERILCAPAIEKGNREGGPWLWLDPERNRYILVGISSYDKGEKITDNNGNTDVFSYIGWINKTVEEFKDDPMVKMCTKK